MSTPGAGERNRSSERGRMVAEQLRNRGIASGAVLAAMERIPREHFVLPAHDEQAYADSALAIDCGQTISQPYMVARMSELLELTPTSRVLEIGTGSGYQAAILACLAQHVYTVEWHLKLLNLAAERLRALGLMNVSYRCADGSLGWVEQTPFDGIIVTAGAPQVPAALCEQLGVGAKLVVPVGGTAEQTLIRVVRTETGLKEEQHLQCRFVKLLGAEGWRE
jgi:protein-L-isoaspartate(D-aspartate) O-methyltransferase